MNAPPCTDLRDATLDRRIENAEVDVGGGGDDVLARIKQGDDVIGVRFEAIGLARRVQDNISVEGKYRSLVVGGDYPGRRKPDQFAGVLPNFAGVVDQHAGQFEVGTLDDLAQQDLADRPRRPLNHAQRHSPSVPVPSAT